MLSNLFGNQNVLRLRNQTYLVVALYPAGAGLVATAAASEVEADAAAADAAAAA